MLIERRVIGEGWKSEKSAYFPHFAGLVEVKDVNVVMQYRPEVKVTENLEDLPYTRKFSPCENFRQFRQRVSLAKVFTGENFHVYGNCCHLYNCG